MPNGDGLIAWNVISRLARRGHRLHVGVEQADLDVELPGTVTLHPLLGGTSSSATNRAVYMARLRRLELDLRGNVSLIHQLNPVTIGMTLGIAPGAPPLVLGPYMPQWPPDSAVRGLARQAVDATKAAVAAAQQRRASMLLLSTPAAGQRAVSTRIPTRVVGFGVDSDAFSPGTGPPETPSILFLANLQRRKGIFELIDAFERLTGASREARLVIAGGGFDERAVRARAKASPRHADIDLLGNVGRHEVAGLLRSSSLYCLPSYGEPFGLSILEAMSCSLPVVATRAGGLPHIVPSGGGRLVPVCNPVALSSALNEVLTDPETAREMGARNRREVLDRFDWERIVDSMEAAYTAVAG